jgi:hypothetical protein
MNPLVSVVMAKLNSMPWMRPALMIATGAALLIQQTVHNASVQQWDARALAVLAVMAAGSVGQSNSGLSPAAPPKA